MHRRIYTAWSETCSETYFYKYIYMCIYSGGAALAYMAVDEALDGVTGAWHDTLPPGKHQLAVHLPSAEGRDVDKQVQLLRPRRPPLPPAAPLAPPNLAAFASRVTQKK